VTDRHSKIDLNFDLQLNNDGITRLQNLLYNIFVSMSIYTLMTKAAFILENFSNRHIDSYNVKGLKGQIMTFQESRKTKNIKN
jgi:hypothetical protein